MKKKSNTVDLTQNPVQPDAQVGTSRRELLKGGAGVVAGVAMAQMLPSEARAAQPNANSNAEVLAQLSKSNADKNRSILLKGGTVITMVGNPLDSECPIRIAPPNFLARAAI